MSSSPISYIAQSALTQSTSEHEQLTRLCKASADALRLNILRVLRQNSYAVQELCEIFEVKQSGMSHHLKLLSQANLIDSKREGNTLFYRRQPSTSSHAFKHYHEGLLASVDCLPLPDKISRTLNSIKNRRSARSLLFFTEHADKFQTQQDLIAEYPQYGDTVASVLDTLLNAQPQAQQRTLALEVGPGEGQFLSELYQRYDTIVALDNNQTMLNKAQHNLQTKNSHCSNIQWLHGDTQHPQLKNLNADLIVLNMVLHHTPTPADIFTDLATVIASHGTLIITDLCRHDQDWAKESCGDLWLGFDTEELESWAHNACFEKKQTLYLSLLNGFRIQVCLFSPSPHLTNQDNDTI